MIIFGEGSHQEQEALEYRISMLERNISSLIITVENINSTLRSVMETQDLMSRRVDSILEVMDTVEDPEPQHPYGPRYDCEGLTPSLVHFTLGAPRTGLDNLQAYMDWCQAIEVDSQDES